MDRKLVNVDSPPANPPALASNAHARWVSHSVLAVLVLLLGAFPWVAPALGLDYYVDFVRRMLIVSMAALSLNFLIGRAGLVALGHAGFVGVGAYAVVAMVEGGFSNAWLIWLVAAVAGMLISAVIGLVAMRTQGVYFIMITLAFAQMLYYLAVSLRAYGGDDGYTMYSPLLLWEGVNAEGNWLFTLVLLVLAAIFLLLSRIERSYFGRALEGIRDNETRMQAMGYPTVRLKLLAFALAGGIAALSGALLATQNLFVSPSLMQWATPGPVSWMGVVAVPRTPLRAPAVGGVVGAPCPTARSASSMSPWPLPPRPNCCCWTSPWLEWGRPNPKKWWS